jgi:hypothetical protein
VSTADHESRGAARGIAHSPDVSWRRVGETLILLDFRTSMYFTLEETAVWIWERIAKGGDVDELAREMSGEFSVEESVARRDIDAFIDSLEAESLIVRNR